MLTSTTRYRMPSAVNMVCPVGCFPSFAIAGDSCANAKGAIFEDSEENLSDFLLETLGYVDFGGLFAFEEF